MLVITRRTGESVLIGEDIIVTVGQIRDSTTRVLVQLGSDIAENREFKLHDIIPINDQVRVSLIQILEDKVRFGIDAPVSMSVTRKEIKESIEKQLRDLREAEARAETDRLPVTLTVTFRNDQFTQEDIELALKYLSAIYHEAGGNGLKVDTVQRLAFDGEGVPS